MIQVKQGNMKHLLMVGNNKKLNINSSELPKGIYILKIENQSMKVVVK